MPKKEILIFVDWFLPGYKAGGPIQSIKNLVENLGDEFQFRILTSNTDLGETTPYKEVPYNTWLNRGVYQIMYLDVAHQNYKYYKLLLREKHYDCVYINSLFSFRFSILPLRAALAFKIQVVLAPRGMLGAGALQLKAKKKQVFLTLYKTLGIHNKIIWHVTAASEIADLKRVFGKNVTYRLASNLSQKSTELIHRKKEADKVNLFFLSRINRKKNLLQALKWVSEIDPKYTVVFTIIGPIDGDSYWKLCADEIENLPKHITVDNKGAVPHTELKSILSKQHCLFLPTYNENYGHVIVESWQFGCLTLISDQTPWQGLEQKGVGWEFPLTEHSAFVKAVEAMAGMSQDEFNVRSQKAYNLAKSICEDTKLLNANRALFE